MKVYRLLFMPALFLFSNRRLLLFSLLFGVVPFLYAQTEISGRVVDSLTQEPLSFANILYDIELKRGVTSDIQGNFWIRTDAEVSRLRISYLGYKTRIVEPVPPGEFVISLSPASLQLEEVVIYGDKNPTEKLIRKVIENKKINNPERLPSFTYRSYNKINYDLFVFGEMPDDSSRIRLEKMADKTGLLIMESVTERRFIFPDKDEEVVTATKVSGFKNPLFASLATDVQPFSFYQEIIPILDRSFVNPIAEGSLSRYEYIIQDTLYEGEDTVYIVAFSPQKGKNFDALTGVLYINTHKFALQNVIARPAEPGLMDVVIEQMYSRMEGEYWFPVQLNFELIIRNYPQKNVGMKARGQGFLHDIKINPELDKKSFGLDNVRMDKNAGKKDSTFWGIQRIDSLTAREIRTYAFMDSVGEKVNFDGIMNQVEKLSRGRLGWKFLEVDVNKLFVFNEFEGNRPGLGLYTGKSLSPWFSLGGYFGYGFRDKAWKYGGNLTLFLYRKRDVELSAAAWHDVIEPGQSLLNLQGGLTQPRSFMATRMDLTDGKQAELSFRGFRYSKITLGGTLYSRSPGYNYTFVRNDGTEWGGTYYSSEMLLRFRYAWREKIVETFGQRLSLTSKYPVVSAVVVKGWENIAGGELPYLKAETEISHTFETKRFGNTQIQLRAGMTRGEVPAPFLFHGSGSKSRSVWIYVENYFQTMNLYEFLSDRYAELFIRQDFGTLLFQTPQFKPQISLVQGIGYGWLPNPERHQGFEFKTMEKGYYESGLLINQIIRLNYVNIAYMGLGGGIFYRYGVYQLPDVKQNLAFKVSVSFSTR
ncbi:MAG: DUF5686 family protein [Bacteroidia bacterium]|nr:DUF5686 family protein [Bacteroidia bacterium]